MKDFLDKYLTPQKENKRKAVGNSQKAKVFDRQKGKCHKCRDKLELSYTEYHHLKHVAKGGKNHTENLVAVCANCHSKIHKEEKANETDQGTKGPRGTYTVNPFTGQRERVDNSLGGLF